MTKKLNINHILFQTIRQEHLEINNAFLHLETSKNKEDTLSTINWLWEYNELTHHKKEELLLFSAIYNNSKINEGGPMCTLFIDSHLSFSPIEKCKKITNKIPEIEENQKVFYDMNSPLKIPVDEHRSGKQILAHIKSNWDTLSEAQMNSYIDTYVGIQKKHIEKEENCLFHMCCELLTIKKADEIYALWLKD